ncbi:hypothetical protein HDE77_000448 [Rhodanobacter sp. MP7CTX1]|nr:hypothetical protein [Rhodanobacter sp. MP7CTX1]
MGIEPAVSGSDYQGARGVMPMLAGTGVAFVLQGQVYAQSPNGTNHVAFMAAKVGAE